jgi:hypothetical protein
VHVKTHKILLYQYAIDLKILQGKIDPPSKNLTTKFCDRKYMLTKNRALGKFPKKKSCVTINTLKYQVSLIFLKQHFHTNTLLL